MTIKVYISGICGSQEVRKHQQRVLFILQSLPIDLQVIDVTEPGKDEDLNFMQETAKKHNKKTQLPPQIFNDNDYCGDYADFELANDDDDIMKFLKLESGPFKAEILKSGGDTITQNGINHENDHENDEEIVDTQETTEVSETNDSNVIVNSEETDASGEKSAENEATPDAGENEQKVSEESKEKAPSEEEESEEESE